MKTLLVTTMVAGLISASGCACIQSPSGKSRPDLDTLGKQLTDLTEAVDATLRLEPAGAAALSDPELLERSTADRPDLRSAFKGYKVTISRAGKAVALLVCTPDGAHVLLEDASCTTQLDRKRWEEAPPAACQTSLQLAAVCPP